MQMAIWRHLAHAEHQTAHRHGHPRPRHEASGQQGLTQRHRHGKAAAQLQHRVHIAHVQTRAPGRFGHQRIDKAGIL